jgi:hypothetical protein
MGYLAQKYTIKYNIAEKCIVRILKKMGYPMRPKSYYRKYNITESFFEKYKSMGRRTIIFIRIYYG